MNYIGKIYRPPSEANSILLQITTGCSHNKCTYCDMYRQKSFGVKPWEVVDKDIQEAAQLGPVTNKLFLCDGDALILPTAKLLRTLERIRECLPWIERVGVYGDTRSVGRKSNEELKALREAGLGIVYHGVESGDDDVLRRIVKGGTRQESIETANKLRRSGLVHSVIVLLGIGGVELSYQHASNTASLLSEMDPPYVGTLTTTVVPNTPLFEEQASGRFRLPDKFSLLEELRIIVKESVFTRCRFSSNHASNYLPLRSSLPKDRDHILAILGKVLERRDEVALKPEHLRGL